MAALPPPAPSLSSPSLITRATGSPPATVCRNVKLSFAYLTWPYPVESRHFRLRTLWQVHYLDVKSNYDAPIRLATPDSSGNLTSYATTGSKHIISPALGLGLTEYASRNFRIELDVSGFDVPHHFAIGDADALASYRLGRFEIRVGGKGLYFETSPQADYYFRARSLGAFVGVRWCSDPSRVTDTRVPTPRSAPRGWRTAPCWPFCERPAFQGCGCGANRRSCS